MFVATLLATVGLAVVALTTQYRGVRLGGTIVVPVLAIYTLKAFFMLPVFLASTVVAVTALALVKRYTLAYGRTELVVAVVSGMVIPVGVLLFVESLGVAVDASEIAFVGSILPGLAAFNYHQLKPQYRLEDLLFATSLLVGLLAAGYLLVSQPVFELVGTAFPAFLFSHTADIAQLKGVSVTTESPVFVSREVQVGLLALGMLAAEFLRRRYGIRLGVISLTLLAIYAAVSAWLVVLFVVALIVAATALTAFHQSTLLYGRVLVSVATIGALLVSLPLTLVVPVVRGISAFFVAILAGVTAYALHATPPADRDLRVPLSLLVFCPSLLVAAALVGPSPRGLITDLTVYSVGLLAVVFVVSAAYVAHTSVPLPSREAVERVGVVDGGGDR